MNPKEEKSSYQKWYADNKETLSDKRKNRYRDDPEFRQQVLERAREWRRTNPKKSRAGEARFKELNGKRVKCFRITEAGELIGRSDQTIRGWEADGLIPKPVVGNVHRYYTENQVMLMKSLASTLDLVRREPKELADEIVQKKSAEIHENWNH